MRYSRQEMMHCIGKEGQEKLSKAHVVVIGAGGLGCFVLSELVVAGVGAITIIDSDIVSESNLNRQFIYKESDIGKSKVSLAIEYLKQRNSSVEVRGIDERIDANNIDLLADAKIVVDCVDNVDTRMLVNDYCVASDIPLVEAAVNGLYGFVMAIKKNYPCLRCIGYEKTKLVGDSEALGAAVGVLASLEALEVIKIIVGMDNQLFGKMLMLDCNEYSIEMIELHKNCAGH